jgi:hypothetical protein
MTCREKLMREHPEKAGQVLGAGGVNACPGHYGYLPTPKWCDYNPRYHTGGTRCAECWDREIPGEEDKFLEFVSKVTAQAMREGIKANSIVINANMVRVPEFTFCDCLGSVRIVPRMICGLNVHLTKDELPEGYSFAVLEGPPNRLQQFESIGMEPEELRKAAELYRKVKEVL